MPGVGLPKGVLSIMHGTVPPVKFLCEEPRIKAISFVGGDKAGQYIYETGNKNGKRVQANLGAKSESPTCHIFGSRKEKES
jgi:malonate-semialdehyde dehydrogenase (acetylating)/methylmalonate-semialdehyde dehydrogenase